MQEADGDGDGESGVQRRSGPRPGKLKGTKYAERVHTALFRSSTRAALHDHLSIYVHTQARTYLGLLTRSQQKRWRFSVGFLCLSSRAHLGAVGNE